ncbi:MAG: NBR1-Ig-like domain-containing protein, partial [Anaerolineales bacterium]
MKLPSRIVALIVVLAAAAVACGGSPATQAPTQPPSVETQTPPGPGTEPPPEATEPSATAEPTESDETGEPCTPDSAFVADVTIPDGTWVLPGSTFTKTWRISNDGDCPWTPEYTWEQINASGNLLLASPLSVPLPAEVAPGASIDISVELTLSSTATVGSEYMAQFQMRSPSGELFGTYPFAIVIAASGIGACPPSTIAHESYIHPSDGYCFRYQVGYAEYPQSDGIMISEPVIPEGTEYLGPFVIIMNRGSVGGQTVQQWATDRIDALKEPGTTPATVSITLGGEPALYTDELPKTFGEFGHRRVFVVHNNTGFEISVSPLAPDSMPGRTAQALDLWGVIHLSFMFFV